MELGTDSEVQKQSERNRGGDQEQQGSEGREEVRLRRLHNGICRKSGRKSGLDSDGDLDIAAEFRMRASAESSHDGPDELKAQHEKDEEHAENLAGAALGQPALNPGENHLHEDHVEHRECKYQQERPGKKRRAGEGDADKDSQQADRSERAGGIEVAIREAYQEE